MRVMNGNIQVDSVGKSTVFRFEDGGMAEVRSEGEGVRLAILAGKHLMRGYAHIEMSVDDLAQLGSRCLAIAARLDYQQKVQALEVKEGRETA